LNFELFLHKICINIIFCTKYLNGHVSVVIKECVTPSEFWNIGGLKNYIYLSFTLLFLTSLSFMHFIYFNFTLCECMYTWFWWCQKKNQTRLICFKINTRFKQSLDSWFLQDQSLPQNERFQVIQGTCNSLPIYVIDYQYM